MDMEWLDRSSDALELAGMLGLALGRPSVMPLRPKDEDVLDQHLSPADYGGVPVPPPLKGETWADLVGDAIFGALSGEALVRADLDGAIARKADHWPMGARIREVEQGPRGEIYLLEDGPSGGRLLRLDPLRR